MDENIKGEIYMFDVRDDHVLVGIKCPQDTIVKTLQPVTILNIIEKVNVQKRKISDLHISILFPNIPERRKYQIVGLEECTKCGEVQMVCLDDYEDSDKANTQLEILKKEYCQEL